jgi:hypothetical protein
MSADSKVAATLPTAQTEKKEDKKDEKKEDAKDGKEKDPGWLGTCCTTTEQ